MLQTTKTECFTNIKSNKCPKNKIYFLQLPIHSAVLFLKCELALCQRILFPRKTGKTIASWTSFGVIHGLLRLCSALSCRQFHQRCFIHCYSFGNVSFISVIFTVFEGPRGLKCLQTFLSDVYANGTPAKHRRIHFGIRCIPLIILPNETPDSQAI